MKRIPQYDAIVLTTALRRFGQATNMGTMKIIRTIGVSRTTYFRLTSDQDMQPFTAEHVWDAVAAYQEEHIKTDMDARLATVRKRLAVAWESST